MVVDGGESDGVTVVLAAELYPDARTIEAALMAQQGVVATKRMALPSAAEGEQGWDALLDVILKAEKVVTL